MVWKQMRQICLVTELFFLSVLVLILEDGMVSKVYFAGLGKEWIVLCVSW